MCACGCGQTVKWNRKIHSWRRYLVGHHSKGNTHRKGKTAWNKGTATEYRFVCWHCGKVGYSRDRSKKYCNIDHYNAHRSNESKYQSVTKIQGTLKTHIVVMEAVLRRPLAKGEEVHHIDSDKANNHPDNLFLFHCHKCHLHHHNKSVELAYVYAEIHVEYDKKPLGYDPTPRPHHP